jgi:predicted DCC family thiol-disulfide oxidoreductase YuxK
MLFDGHCHMCSNTVQTVLAMDREGDIRFAPVQSELGRALLLARGMNPDDPASFVFFDGGLALTRSAAILAMAKRFPWPWRAAGIFGLLPRPARGALYDLVARNRYRLFGRRDACFVPTPDQRARFLG